MTPEDFLQHYWQKKPLLVRNALPGFQGLLTRQELVQLAANEDVQSRLIANKNTKWHLKYGPLTTKDFTRLPADTWSLLVQEVNHFLPSARDLLQKFGFIPFARLDDLMVSYAPAGGGIGPHFDSYDVFLLQGFGRRRWEIAGDYDQTLVADAPLKILQHFKPEHSWILEPGDMLYLPPNYAHHGTALDACMTYSIGFRAPSHQELITQFLIYLQDNLQVDGWYIDPDLKLQPNPWKIHREMQRQVHSILKKIKWRASDVEDFLGVYLTEPKSHIFFDCPEHPLTYKKFKNVIRKKNIQLDLKSRMLCQQDKIFLNGEAYKVNTTAKKNLSGLIYRRNEFSRNNLDDEAGKVLYQWYVNGYINIIDIA
ncbi:cupin domain-containing protein [Nitrosomonas aestuarii]|uniref:cupin domain-containing protein n=1 Tax=Nitrosomonas aestuarii TaxID=52441 RepID=UPI000D4C5168|nr:cupin domain-containing protein [Nitrosomonas aestuarii]PTN11898.1 50S ribosomal protein L16 3-hydroxylase [Nitrosomonas aestuarii]